MQDNVMSGGTLHDKIKYRTDQFTVTRTGVQME